MDQGGTGQTGWTACGWESRSGYVCPQEALLLLNNPLPSPPREEARDCVEDSTGNLASQIPIPACVIQWMGQGSKGHPASFIPRMVSLPPGTNSCCPIYSGTKRSAQRMWQEWNPQYACAHEEADFCDLSWRRGCNALSPVSTAQERNWKQSP